MVVGVGVAAIVVVIAVITTIVKKSLHSVVGTSKHNKNQMRKKPIYCC